MVQTQKNLYTNVANLLVNILVGLYYTPYLVSELGLAAYGIVPLTLIINQYIGVLTGSLTGALSRFYTIYLQQEKFKEASEVISTTLIAFSILILILLPIVWWFITDINTVFNIPFPLIKATQLLFLFTITSFFVSLLSSSLSITLYAKNRLDLMNLINVVRIGFKFGLVILFFETIDKSIIYIGVANLGAEVLILILNIVFFINQTRQNIRIKVSCFSRTALSGILGMTLWTIIHQLGDVGLYRVDNIIVNRHWGVEFSGALGAISEFGIYISLLVGVISSLFGPIILIAYSKREHANVQVLTLDNSLMVGVLTSVIVGGLVGCSSIVLKYWLGDAYMIYNVWLIAKLLSLPFFAAAGIFAYVNRSWNEVKYPAISTVILGSVNMIGLLLISKLSVGDTFDTIKWMLFFSILIIVVQSFGVNSFFFNKIYPGNKQQIQLIFAKMCIALLLSVCVSIGVFHLYSPANILELVVLLIISGIVSLVLLIFMLFNSRQRIALITIVK